MAAVIPIKPCPFCGADDAMLDFDDVRQGWRNYYFRCRICGARTNPIGVRHDASDEQKGSAHMKAIAMWNQRAV